MISATLQSNYQGTTGLTVVLLEASGQVQAAVNVAFGTFRHGPRLESLSRWSGSLASWVEVASSTFAYLKIGHQENRYWAEIYPDSKKPVSRQYGDWESYEYGTRTVDGVQEAYVRAVGAFRNPDSTLGDNTATAIFFTLTTEWYVREGEGRVYRRDIIDGEEGYPYVDWIQFARIGNVDHPARGRLKRILEDGEAIPTVTGPATITLSTDRVVGSKSLDISVPAGSAGQAIEWTTSGEAFDVERIFSYRLKQISTTDIDDAVQFYLIDSVGGKQYISGPVSLIQELELNASKNGHDLVGIWRQNFADLNGLTRSNVTAWGIEILSDQAMQFLFDDCWIYDDIDVDLSASVNDSWSVGAAFPDAFVDETASPGSDPDITKDFNKLARLPFLCHLIPGGAGSIGFAITPTYRTSVLTGQFAQTEGSKLIRYAKTALGGRITTGDMTRWESECVFILVEAADADTAWSQVVSEYEAYDSSPVTSKTSSDLPDLNHIVRALQGKPFNRYRSSHWHREIWERLGGDYGVQADLLTVHKIYRDPHGWLYNAQPVSTVLDTKNDLLQQAIDMCKATVGMAILTESVIAISESSKNEISHYNRKHQAGRANGKRDDRIFWIYEDPDGYFLLRKTYAEDYPFPSSYYDDVFEDGRTYSLSYTYPAHLSSRASVYLHQGEFGIFNEPTLCDKRLAQITFLVNNYDLDAITLSEDTIFYGRSFSAKDLEFYNYWRQNVRVPALPALAEFDRIDNGQPVSDANPYKADDQDLWDWQNWAVSRAVSEIRDVCHAKGVMVILDCNVETTVPVQDPASPLYDPGQLIYDAETDSYFTRQFDLYGQRFGVDYRKMLPSADLLYMWLYGEYSPLGPVQATQEFLTWAANNNYHGRFLMAPGLYPRSAPPTSLEMRDQIIACGQAGFPVIMPAGKPLDQYEDDYWLHFMEAMTVIPDATLAAGVLTLDNTRGCYFPKAIGNITLSIPGGSTVYHYDIAHNLKNTYLGYSGETITISAGDSLVIKTTVTPLEAQEIEFRSRYLRGYGPVHYGALKLCRDAGLSDDQIDTSTLTKDFYGHVMSGESPIRKFIEELRIVGQFDCIESNAQLKFISRGSSIPVKSTGQDGSADGSDPDLGTTSFANNGTSLSVISEDDLGAANEESSQPSLVITRRQEHELSRALNLAYMSREQSYRESTQVSTRINTSTRSVRSITLPMVLNDAHASSLVQSLHYEEWLGRLNYQGQLSQKHLALDPADVLRVTVNEREHVIRVLHTRYGDGVISFEAAAEDPSVYEFDSAHASGLSDDLTIKPLSQTIAMLLDIPLLQDADPELGFYLAAAPETDGAWRGSFVDVSPDDGTAWNTIASINTAAVIGVANTVLGDGPTTIWDRGNTVNVTLYGTGTLESRTELSVLNGEGAAVLGNEIIQWADAVLESDGSYTLSNLLRGRLGSDWATGTHQIGERFVVLQTVRIKRIKSLASEINQSRLYRDYSAGEIPDAADEYTFKNTGISAKPYSPAHLKATRDASEDITITWIRRARKDGEWNDYRDVPLDEPSENYDIEIIDNGNVKRTITSNVPSVVYTAAQQVADFGSTQTAVTVRVYQLSQYVGRGYPIEETI